MPALAAVRRRPRDAPLHADAASGDEEAERDADDDGVVAENQEDGHRLGVADT